MLAVVLAGGFAKRLWPLTKDTPKPLLDVGGKPIIEHVMEKILEIRDVDKVLVSTNKRFEKHFKDWLGKAEFNKPVKLITEPTVNENEKLGSIGGLKFLIEKERIDDNMLVVAGDNLFMFSLVGAYDFFKERKVTVNALYDAKSIKVAREQGTVLIDGNNRFISFEEKAENPKSTLISLGIYFFPRGNVKLIPLYVEQGNNPDKMGYFIQWLMENYDVYGYIFQEKWFDIGWPESLEEARKEFGE